MDFEEIASTSPRVVALVGNPNSGKTSLFNAISGMNQRVGNFPGVTVERKSADIELAPHHHIRLIDLPGVNSLYPVSEDERVTSDILQQSDHPDFPHEIWVVVDATQLRRGLMLCSQVMDLGFPIKLVVNMMDLVAEEGAQIDLVQLHSLLGVEVYGISVAKGEGLEPLKHSLRTPAQQSPQSVLTIPPGFQPALQTLKPLLDTPQDYRAYQVLLNPQLAPGIPPTEVEILREAAQITQTTADQLIRNELLVRLDRADNWLKMVWKDPPTPRERWTERVDDWLTHPVWGYLIFVGILLLIFQAIFVWATYPMTLIETGIASLGEGLGAMLPEGWGSDLLINGVIAGIGGIVVFIPQIAFLFLFIAILEDSGYMARAVFIMDRIMIPFGFSGRSVIPLVGGMACAIPSIMMTRVMGNRKERLITILVTPLISCSARIPVYTLLIAMFIPAEKILGIDQRGLVMMGLYILGFVMALIVAWVFKHILKQDQQRLPFVMELPAFRWPRWKNIGHTVWQKSASFVTEAGKVILAISVVLWFLVSYGPQTEQTEIVQRYEQMMEGAEGEEMLMQLEQAQATEILNHSYAAKLGKTIEPLIAPLGYDWKIGIALVTSFAAREVFVSTMTIIYQQQNLAEEDELTETGRLALVSRLQAELDPDTGKPVYSLATVLSLLIFYVFAMQCVSTLAVTQKEAGWKWALVMLTYLTGLAYVAAFGTYQLVNFLA